MAEEEEVVYDLTNPEVTAKYGFAAGVANRALAKVIELIQPGARIADICSAGDEFITSQLKSQFRGAEKGVAFPTCLSVNECAGHFSPLFSETPVLQDGDVVKIDLGAHVDGLIGVVGHTVVCTADPSVPTTGRKSDVICAAYYAAEAALRLLRPGNKSSQIPPVLDAIAKTFRCNMVEGVVSHQLKRFVLDGEKTIPSRISPDTPTPTEIEFEESEVYAIDIVVSTGEGKLRERDARTTVYQRETNTAYSLQMKAAKAVFKQVNQRFPALPFSLRALEDEKQTRLGIVECVKHEVLRPFPVLFERPGEFIAQFKFTVLLLPKEIKKITFGASIPFVQSEYKIEDPKILQILKTGLKRGANMKKKKTAKTGTAAAATATTTTTATITTSTSTATDAMETE